MARVSSVITPSAPRWTTAPGKSGWPRSMVTSSPVPLIKVMAVTADANVWLRLPEPWVAVATDPATEMCGSEARLASAQPADCSRAARSP